MGLVLSIPQMIAWVQAGQTLVAAGVQTVDGIRTLIKSSHQEIGEAELNAICDEVAAGAARHRRLAALDAGAA